MKRIGILLLVGALTVSVFACVPDAAPASNTPVSINTDATALPQETPAPMESATEAPAMDAAGLNALLLQISTDYQPGSAGCSLRAAKLAGQLLDWYAKNPADAVQLAQAMQSATAALSQEAAAAYAGQFDDIYRTAVELTQDYALNYLESAGYAPEAYPYSHDSVDALFSALQQGIPAEWIGYLRRVEPMAPISIDMDGDGVPETVTVAADEMAWVTDVTVSGENGTFTDHQDFAMTYMSAYIGDAWLGNGGQALFLCGDEASDDYSTVIYRMKDGELQHAVIFGRLLEANSKGVLTIERSIDVFGTYGGVCQYQLQDDFTFSLCTPYRVQNYGDNWEERKLTVICGELPVTVLDGTDASTTLPKGTELALRETDQQTYAVLENANGDDYRVAIEKHEDDWQWYIDGMAEDQCFTPLLYAG